jgi:hypothetical protein
MSFGDHAGLHHVGERPLIPCDVRDVPVDLTTVGALARLQLEAARCGAEVRLQHGSPALLALIAFAGLDAVLRVGDATR